MKRILSLLPLFLACGLCAQPAPIKLTPYTRDFLTAINATNALGKLGIVSTNQTTFASPASTDFDMGENSITNFDSLLGSGATFAGDVQVTGTLTAGDLAAATIEADGYGITNVHALTVAGVLTNAVSNYVAQTINSNAMDAATLAAFSAGSSDATNTTGISGYEVEGGEPTDGYILKYNTSSNAWYYAEDSGAAEGISGADGTNIVGWILDSGTTASNLTVYGLLLSETNEVDELTVTNVVWAAGTPTRLVTLNGDGEFANEVTWAGLTNSISDLVTDPDHTNGLTVLAADGIFHWLGNEGDIIPGFDSTGTNITFDIADGSIDLTVMSTDHYTYEVGSNDGSVIVEQTNAVPEALNYKYDLSVANLATATNLPVSGISWSNTFSATAFTNIIAGRIPIWTNASSVVFYLTVSTNAP